MWCVKIRHLIQFRPITDKNTNAYRDHRFFFMFARLLLAQLVTRKIDHHEFVITVQIISNPMHQTRLLVGLILLHIEILILVDRGSYSSNQFIDV